MARPPRFTSTEATASMMDRMRDDPEPVTTYQLPKGNISSASPARSSSASRSFPFDTSGFSRSPGGRPLPAHLQGLQSVGALELLEQDERPSFVIDLFNPTNVNPSQLTILFSNASLRSSQILDLLSPDTSDPAVGQEFDRFKAWVFGPVRDGDNETLGSGSGSFRPPDPTSLIYGGISWSCSTLRRRYRVVSGNASVAAITPTFPDLPVLGSLTFMDELARGPTLDEDLNTPQDSPRNTSVDYFGSIDDSQDSESQPRTFRPIQESPQEMSEATGAQAGLQIDEQRSELLIPSFDWTRIAVTPSLPQHIQFARSVDWAATPLGPIESWPADLRTMSNLIMGSPHPSAMYWGREYIAIYNEAYTKLAGQKHPRMMGMSYQRAWAEIWDNIKPVFDSAWNWGQATMKHDDRLFVVRNGFLEETFFNWSIIPLVGGDGTVVALYNPAFENTRRKVNERRMLTLREVGEKTSLAKDIRSFWGLVLKGLEYNEFDVPFVMIYSAVDDSESEASSLHSGNNLAYPPRVFLEGVLGVPSGHPVAVESLDLRTSEEGFAPYMRESMNSPVVLTKEAGTLPTKLIDGLKWRGFGDPCRTIVVFPVHPTPAGDAVVGFIVIGTNPRRPYNEDYGLFIQLLSRQLATSMASVVLFEEEIRRGQRAAQLAALDRQELSLQLRLRTQEAVESEWKFTRMAELAPVGMFITNSQGQINYCNDMWWEISRHPRSADTSQTWMQSVREEDLPGLQTVWKKLVTEKVSVTYEFRFKTASEADGHPVDTWVLMSAFPEKDESGEIKRIFGSITDISQQKWAETFQRQRREEAVELKRQQESFIDMTSHEMRNPLSAILQCADEIANGLARLQAAGGLGGGDDKAAELRLLVEGCVEAANTISLCASHQKRIVDDILTFSKLDSALLLVTPMDTQPVATVQNVLKMFEAELRGNGIYLEFRVEKSYEDLGVDWVKIDPSRLRQVLINLMTNAIKFTNSCQTRSIIVSVGASRDYGDGNPPAGLVYFPSRQSGSENLTDGPEWGTGEKIYLHFAVNDAGPGLDENEKKVLFQRFSQVSPRTHVKYGGSGLGLYICRNLSELQGGQISVTSEKGAGSTFAFYIKARKTDPNMLSPSALLPPASSPFGPTARQQWRGQGQGRAPSSFSSSRLQTVQYTIASIISPAAMATTRTPKTSVAVATGLKLEKPIGQREAATASATTGQPTVAAPAPTSASASAADSPQGASEALQGSQKQQPLDVLIVEDNIVNQRVLQRQLLRCGNNILVANHGGEALDVLRRSRFWRPPLPSSSSKGDTTEEEGEQHAARPDKRPKPQPHQNGQTTLVSSASISTTASNSASGKEKSKETDINISVILMDLEMPVMDGMTCARRIRELERDGTIMHHIPIIAVTAYARPEQIHAAKAAGIDDVISKPFRIPDLIPKIEELVTKYGMRPGATAAGTTGTVG